MTYRCYSPEYGDEDDPMDVSDKAASDCEDAACVYAEERHMDEPFTEILVVVETDTSKELFAVGVDYHPTFHACVATKAEHERNGMVKP